MAPPCLMTEQDGAAACVPARARRVFSRMGIAGRTSAGRIQSPKINIGVLAQSIREIAPRGLPPIKNFLLVPWEGRSA
jgi:hypothetical protein